MSYRGLVSLIPHLGGVVPPDAPANLAITGASGGVVGTRTPTVTFTAAPGATSHKLQWSTDSGFSSVTGETTITMPTAEYTHTVALTHNTTYYWRVAAVGAGGQGEWSDTVSALVYDYIAYVLSVQPANLIAYWPLNEASGSTADNAEGTAARDGTYGGTPDYQGATIAGQSVAKFPATSYVNVLTASLNTNWPINEATFMTWISTSAAWWSVSPATNQQGLFISVDAGNEVNLYVQSTNNRYAQLVRMGGTLKYYYHNVPGSKPDVTMLAVAWSKSNDRIRFYVNGAQVGATQTGLGTWTGSLANARLGAFNTGGNYQCTEGSGHDAIWNTELSPAEILALYNAANPT